MGSKFPTKNPNPGTKPPAPACAPKPMRSIYREDVGVYTQVAGQPPKPVEPCPVVIREDQTQVAGYINDDGSIEQTEFGRTQWKRDLRNLLIAFIALVVLLSAIVANVLGAEVTKYRVIDADTVEAELRLEFGYLTRPEVFRLHNFDAWESRRIRKSLNLTPAQWDAEIPKGKAAKSALEKLLSEAKVIELREVKALKADPRGRELADLYADGVNVADVLRQNGHERK